MKNKNAQLLLHKFFSICFKSGICLTEWYKSHIKPIPKKDKDPRDPLNNRCITIMCCVAKVYSSILNRRIQAFLEENNLLVDEQNGFRASRSCIDHIFSLCSILRNRKLQGYDTFISFVDFKKAFDSVDRTILLFKIQQMGIVGDMYRAISAMYKCPQSRVFLNEHCTDWFPCPSGVKQGDTISPTLFSIFINDLVVEIKTLGLGVKLSNDLVVDCLLYADDVVFLAPSEENLQQMLNFLHKWCCNWRIEANLTKTNVMHI